jgi:aminotransferase
VVKDAACAAIRADVNHTIWGTRGLREAIAREFTRRHGLPIVADEQVTVCGATEAMMATMLGIIDPGDRSSSSSRSTRITAPTRSCRAPRRATSPCTSPTGADPDELAAAFNNRTKAIILNTPNNPTGKVLREKSSRRSRPSARNGT